MDALKIEIGKGTKEMRALQLMIQTYTNTPQVKNLRALIRSCYVCSKIADFYFSVWRRGQIPTRAQHSGGQSAETGGGTVGFAGEIPSALDLRKFLCGYFKGFIDLPEDFKV